MGQDPSTIREDIEQTRERMGDTVDALAYKSDVKARAKDSVTGRVDAVKEKLVGAGDAIGEATPDAGDVKQATREAVGVAQSNPLGLAIGATAAGFIAGMLIPATSIENEKVGPMADQLKDRASEAAQTVVDHGSEAIKDATDAAFSAAGDAGREHAQAAKADLKQQAQETREQIAT